MQGKPLQERQILPASAAALEIAEGFRAKKKTPEHCLLNGVFEKSLAAAYFPT